MNVSGLTTRIFYQVQGKVQMQAGSIDFDKYIASYSDFPKQVVNYGSRGRYERIYQVCIVLHAFNNGIWMCVRLVFHLGKYRLKMM